MKKLHILFALFLLFTISCNKDNITPIEEEINTPENWLATQNVRILKVELKRKLWAIPFEGAENAVVNYYYGADGIISKTTLSFADNPDFYVHNWESSSNEYLMSGFSYPVPNRLFILRDNKYFFNNNSIKEIKGNFGTWIPTMGILTGDYYRNVNFDYSNEGLLTSIKSVFSYNEIEKSNITYKSELKNIQYNKNVVTSFLVNGNEIKESLGKNEFENYTVNVAYESSNDVPDGLSRLVNQAILGLSSIGMEEAFNNPEYVNDSVRNALDPNVSSSVFVDWIYSFACPKIQTIPAQGIGLVSQKRIVGKRISHIEYNSEEPTTIYTQVDSTANFPYIHDASDKTLEIAGLKIYYELVE